MAYKLRNKNAASLMAKSPLYNTPPNKAEYKDDPLGYEQAVVKYDRARGYNPNKVEYDPNDPSTYSEAKLTKAHVKPNVRGAVGQMSPAKYLPGSKTDSKGRLISTQQDDPNFDASGRRTLVKVTGDENNPGQRPQKSAGEKSTKSKAKPKPPATKSKANTTSGFPGVGRPTQSGNTKPTNKDNNKANNSKKKPAPATSNTKKDTKPTATQTTIDKTIASQPTKGLGASDMVSAIKDKVSKTQATVDKAINTGYDLISSQPKSGGRVGRVRRRQQKRTANLEKRLQNRAEIQGIRQSERGKRQSIREKSKMKREANKDMAKLGGSVPTKSASTIKNTSSQPQARLEKQTPAPVIDKPIKVRKSKDTSRYGGTIDRSSAALDQKARAASDVSFGNPVIGAKNMTYSQPSAPTKSNKSNRVMADKGGFDYSKGGKSKRSKKNAQRTQEAQKYGI